MASHILDANAVRLHELTNERYHGFPLRFSSRVLALANKVASADIADAEAIAIPAFAVRSDNLLGSALLNFAVKGYDVVISTPLPTFLPVPTVNVSNSKLLALARR